MLFRARLVGMLDIWPAFLYETTCSLSARNFIIITIGAVVGIVGVVLIVSSAYPMGCEVVQISVLVFQMLEYLHIPNVIFGSINLNMHLFMLHSHIYVQDLALGNSTQSFK